MISASNKSTPQNPPAHSSRENGRCPCSSISRTLQIADLIAYPIACHLLWPEKENPAYDIIKGNIYISDGKELGIKVIK